MATINFLARQVLLRISGGDTESASAVKLPDVKAAVVQKLNYLLKGDYLNVSLSEGETIPNGLMVYTYENVPVFKKGTLSRSELPFIPMALPKNIGILEVSSNENFTDLFIPVQTSQNFFLKSQDVLNDIIDITYTPNGVYIDYNKNLLAEDIDKVFIKMVGIDFKNYDEFDLLPIPSDLETILVEDLVKQFLPFQQSDKVVDSYVAIQSSTNNNK